MNKLNLIYLVLKSFLFLSLFSCSDINSNSNDKSLYTPVILDSGGDNKFAAAYQVLTLRCIWCHNHTSWASYTSDALWISNRKIVKGDASNSPIIVQIQAGSMPQSGSISPAETQSIIDWINSIP